MWVSLRKRERAQRQGRGTGGVGQHSADEHAAPLMDAKSTAARTDRDPQSDLPGSQRPWQEPPDPPRHP